MKKSRVLIVGLTCLSFAITTPAALVGHWKLDEASSSTAFDSSGNSYDATGGPTASDDGVVGRASYINRTAHFTTPDLEALDGATAMTMSLWLKADASTDYKGLLMTRQVQDSSGVDQNWGVGVESGPRIDWRASGVSGNVEPVLDLDTWYHVAVVWDGTATSPDCVYYLNGVEVAGSSLHSGATSIIDSGPWSIGTDDANASRRFDGYIDDVAMWDEALTASEVLSIYNGGKAGVDAAVAAGGRYATPITVVSHAVEDLNHYGEEGVNRFEMILNNTGSTTGRRGAARYDADILGAKVGAPAFTDATQYQLVSATLTLVERAARNVNNGTLSGRAGAFFMNTVENSDWTVASQDSVDSGNAGAGDNGTGWYGNSQARAGNVLGGGYRS